MPPRPVVPPSSSLAGPVRLSDAAALGLSRSELSSPRWRRGPRGVRVHHSIDPLDPRGRLRATLAWLPPWAVLGGWAALRWQGVVLLDGRTGPAGKTLLPVLVHVGPRRHLRSRDGYEIDRTVLPDGDVRQVRGALVTSPTRAVLDVMCRDGVEEGMVAGDAALATGVLTAAEMTAYVDTHARARGVSSARRATALLDGKIRSVPESRFRYVWVVVAGLPVPLVNRGVVDADGHLVGLADLLDVEAGTAGEYDGSDHRSLTQHTAANVREEAFEALNLTVVRATALDLWPHRADLVRRLREGRQRGQDRDRSRDLFGVRSW